jgi:hypothetical protein
VKKVFQLKDEKKHEDRVLEGIKHEVRKYIKREKRKTLPESETMYWDFDCKVGAEASSAQTVEFDALIKAIDTVKESGAEQCYVEVLSKAVEKPPRKILSTVEADTLTIDKD